LNPADKYRMPNEEDNGPKDDVKIVVKKQPSESSIGVLDGPEKLGFEDDKTKKTVQEERDEKRQAVDNIFTAAGNDSQLQLVIFCYSVLNGKNT
jgi:hypothetical protein